jgi:hypothetical protein
LGGAAQVVAPVAVLDVGEGVGGAQDLRLVHAVAAGADEGAFDVGAERLGAVFAAVGGA